ncbi:CDC16 protein [Dispira simplex]|nr:CDC16 protein [Dispira simplex]
MFARPQPLFHKLRHHLSLDQLRERQRTKDGAVKKGRAHPSPLIPSDQSTLGNTSSGDFITHSPLSSASTLRTCVGTSWEDSMEIVNKDSEVTSHTVSRMAAHTLFIDTLLAKLCTHTSTIVRPSDLYTVVTTSHRTEYQRQQTLQLVRQCILHQVLTARYPDDTLRGTLWKLLLYVESLTASDYIRWVQNGPSSLWQKIKCDVTRTLATDDEFSTRVQEAQLTRVLNAFVWKSEEQGKAVGPDLAFTYVQGMNVLAAPFLYTLGELEAFYALNTLLHQHCPTYVQPTLVGVHAGLCLLDACLKVLDYPLYQYLRRMGLRAELYAFPSVLTLSACRPPLRQVIQLWDFLFAYGVHLNLVCIVAQLISLRDQIMSSPRPINVLRPFPPLDACATVKLTLSLLRQLPRSLYDNVVRHTVDFKVAHTFGHKATSR